MRNYIIKKKHKPKILYFHSWMAFRVKKDKKKSCRPCATSSLLHVKYFTRFLSDCLPTKKRIIIWSCDQQIHRCFSMSHHTVKILQTSTAFSLWCSKSIDKSRTHTLKFPLNVSRSGGFEHRYGITIYWKNIYKKHQCSQQ